MAPGLQATPRGICRTKHVSTVLGRYGCVSNARPKKIDILPAVFEQTGKKHENQFLCGKWLEKRHTLAASFVFLLVFLVDSHQTVGTVGSRYNSTTSERLSKGMAVAKYAEILPNPD